MQPQLNESINPPILLCCQDTTKQQIKCQKTRPNLNVPQIQCHGEILGLGVRREGARFRLRVSGVSPMID